MRMKRPPIRALMAIAAMTLAAAMVIGFAGTGASAQEASVREFTQISSGGFHSCAVQPDNTVICWGEDNFNQATPPSDIAVTQVSAGTYHTCAVQTDGTPICWGQNEFDRATPPEGITVTQIAAGSAHTCAVQTNGTPICWGREASGRTTPPDGITVTQISNGSGSHSCAVQTDGTPVCWGQDGYGQSTPPDGITVTQISTGSYHSCAAQTDGTPICWGSDDFGQSTPPDGITVTQMAAGSINTCALQTDGTPICWGGQSFYDRVPIPSDTTLTQIDAGNFHACGLQTDNTAICWGYDVNGQTAPPEANIDPVAADDTFTAIAGTTVSFDICANDVANEPSLITRIDGWYGPGLARGSFSFNRCFIRGTPTTVGTYNYTYLLTDVDGNTDTAQVTITIIENPVDVAPDAQPDIINGTVGVFLSFDICANDIRGNGPLEPRRVSGWYGPGLSRTNWCTVSGTPTTAGTYSYTYRVTDNDGDADATRVTTIISS